MPRLCSATLKTAIATLCCMFISVLVLFSSVLWKQQGDAVQHAECAMVFGAAVYGWDTPGPALLRRISTAVRLYHERIVDRLIVSGGKTSETDQSEAQVMQRYAVRNNVPASAIALEEKSRSTWENIAYSMPLLADCDSIVAVSDGFHLARIHQFFFWQGKGSVAAYPADQSPNVAMNIRSAVRETGIIVIYAFFRPWLDADALPVE